MDSGILCQLIANRIDSKKFQLWGLEIKWLAEPTADDLANAKYVQDNYSALEAAYIATKKAEEDAMAVLETQKLADILTNLPSWAQVETAIKNAFPTTAQQNVILKMARALYWLAKGTKA